MLLDNAIHATLMRNELANNRKLSAALGADSYMDSRQVTLGIECRSYCGVYYQLCEQIRIAENRVGSI